MRPEYSVVVQSLGGGTVPCGAPYSQQCLGAQPARPPGPTPAVWPLAVGWLLQERWGDWANCWYGGSLPYVESCLPSDEWVPCSFAVAFPTCNIEFLIVNALFIASIYTNDVTEAFNALLGDTAQAPGRTCKIT